MRNKLKIVVNERGHLDVIDEDAPQLKETFKNMDFGQVVNTYREFGYRHVREDDVDWLIQGDDWVEIDEVVKV